MQLSWTIFLAFLTCWNSATGALLCPRQSPADSGFTASSSVSGYEPYCARLNYANPNAGCSTADNGEVVYRNTEGDGSWWQVDFGSRMLVQSIEVKGNSARNEYIQQAQALWSNDGTNWASMDTFSPNSNAADINNHAFTSQTFIARYFRLELTTCVASSPPACSLRIALYACETGFDVQPYVSSIEMLTINVYTEISVDETIVCGLYLQDFLPSPTEVEVGALVYSTIFCSEGQPCPFQLNAPYGQTTFDIYCRTESSEVMSNVTSVTIGGGFLTTIFSDTLLPNLQISLFDITSEFTENVTCVLYNAAQPYSPTAREIIASVIDSNYTAKTTKLLRNNTASSMNLVAPAQATPYDYFCSTHTSLVVSPRRSVYSAGFATQPTVTQVDGASDISGHSLQVQFMVSVDNERAVCVLYSDGYIPMNANSIIHADTSMANVMAVDPSGPTNVASFEPSSISLLAPFSSTNYTVYCATFNTSLVSQPASITTARPSLLFDQVSAQSNLTGFSIKYVVNNGDVASRISYIVTDRFSVANVVQITSGLHPNLVNQNCKGTIPWSSNNISLARYIPCVLGNNPPYRVWMAIEADNTGLTPSASTPAFQEINVDAPRLVLQNTSQVDRNGLAAAINLTLFSERSVVYYLIANSSFVEGGLSANQIILGSEAYVGEFGPRDNRQSQACFGNFQAQSLLSPGADTPASSAIIDYASVPMYINCPLTVGSSYSLWLAMDADGAGLALIESTSNSQSNTIFTTQPATASILSPTVYGLSTGQFSVDLSVSDGDFDTKVYLMAALSEYNNVAAADVKAGTFAYDGYSGIEQPSQPCWNEWSPAANGFDWTNNSVTSVDIAKGIAKIHSRLTLRCPLSYANDYKVWVAIEGKDGTFLTSSIPDHINFYPPAPRFAYTSRTRSRIYSSVNTSGFELEYQGSNATSTTAVYWVIMDQLESDCPSSINISLGVGSFGGHGSSGSSLSWGHTKSGQVNTEGWQNDGLNGDWFNSSFYIKSALPANATYKLCMAVDADGTGLKLSSFDDPSSMSFSIDRDTGIIFTLQPQACEQRDPPANGMHALSIKDSTASQLANAPNDASSQLVSTYLSFLNTSSADPGLTPLTDQFLVYGCMPGYYLEGNLTSQCLPDQSYSSLAPVCLPCATGSWSPGGVVESFCRACPSNATTLTAASTSFDTCICDQQYESVGGNASTCEPCQLNWFKTSVGNDQCIWKNCLSQPCQNGGTCVGPDGNLIGSIKYNSSWVCECAPGFSGNFCNPDFTAPVATLVGPNTLGACDDFTLDATGSYNLENGAVFVWSVAPPPINTTLAEISSDDLRWEFEGESLNILSLTQQVLQSNVEYVFELYVRRLNDNISSAIVTHTLSVADAPLPSIALTAPQHVLRPSATLIYGNIEPSVCATGVRLARFWELLSPTMNQSTSLLSLLNATTQASLYIPANILSPNTEYSFALNARVIDDSNMTNTENYPIAQGIVSFMVGVSPLVATIAGSQERSRDVDVTILIDGSLSYDPDSPGSTLFTYDWFCQISQIPSTETVIQVGDNCDFSGSGGLDLEQEHNQDLTLDPNTLTAEFSYQFTMCLDYGLAREACQIVVIHATVSDDYLEPVISPTVIQINPGVSNGGDTLRVNTARLSRSSTPTTELEYEWAITWQATDSSGDTGTLDATDPNFVSTSPTVSSLAIVPGVLEGNREYTLTLTARDPLVPSSISEVDPSQGVTTASISITVNAPPTSGSLSVLPSSGIALETKFQITCVDWEDPEGNTPLTYAFYYYTASDPSLKLLRPAVAGGTSYLTALPTGNITITAKISDDLGAIATVSSSPINCTHPTLANSDEALAYAMQITESVLTDAIDRGDISSQLAAVDEVSSVLASDTLANITTTTDDNSNATRTKQALTQTLVDTLDKIDKQDPSIASSVLSALAAVTKRISTMGDSSTTSDNDSSFSSSSSSSSQADSTFNILKESISTFTSNGQVDSTAADKSLQIMSSTLQSTPCDTYTDITSLLTSVMTTIQAQAVGSETAYFISDSISITSTRVASIVDAGDEGDLVIPAELLNGDESSISTQDVDSAASLELTKALDIHLITFDSSVSECFGGNQSLVDSVTNAFFTNRSGHIVDASALNEPIKFTLPIVEKATYTEFLNILNGESWCGSEQELLDSSFACQWWNPDTQEWSTEGCSVDSVFNDGESIVCACNHFTEFALLQSVEDQSGKKCSSSLLGHWLYLFLAIIYISLATVASVQLIRVVIATGWTQKLLMVGDHTSLVLLSILRFISMLVFYESDAKINSDSLTVLLLLPNLVSYWVFTFLIFAWAAISYAKHPMRSTNPFSEFKPFFLGVNIGIVILNIILFVSFFGVSDQDTKDDLSLAGALTNGLLMLATSVFFWGFGVKLVRALTAHFPSTYAKKLFTYATIISLCLCGQSILQIYSRAETDAYVDNFNLLNGVYFALDIACQTLVLLLFHKSVADAWDKRRGGSAVSGGRASGNSSSSRNTQSKSSSSRRTAAKESVELNDITVTAPATTTTTAAVTTTTTTTEITPNRNNHDDTQDIIVNPLRSFVAKSRNAVV